VKVTVNFLNGTPYFLLDILVAYLEGFPKHSCHRQLHTSEHRSHIRRNTNTQSVITNHRVGFDHFFNWDEVQILDREPFLNKRLISEMLFIKRQKNGLNLQTDTERLPEIYLNIVNSLPKI